MSQACLDVVLGDSLLTPLQKLTESRAAMAVLGFLLGRDLGKRFVNLGKVKQRIVAKSVRTLRRVENDALGRASERGKSLAVKRGGQYADESTGTFFGGHSLQFS